MLVKRSQTMQMHQNSKYDWKGQVIKEKSLWRAEFTWNKLVCTSQVTAITLLVLTTVNLNMPIPSMHYMLETTKNTNQVPTKFNAVIFLSSYGCDLKYITENTLHYVTKYSFLAISNQREGRDRLATSSLPCLLPELCHKQAVRWCLKYTGCKTYF